MPEPTTPQLTESEVADIECVWIGGGEVPDERIGALIRDWRALTANLQAHREAMEAFKQVLDKREEEHATLREQLAEAQANVESLSQIIFRNEHATAMCKKCVEKMKDILRPYELEFRRKTNSATNIVDYAAMALESLTLDNVERKQ